MFSYKGDIRFIKGHHLRGQEKDSMVAYFSVGIKAPGKGMNVKKEKSEGDNQFLHFGC
jgi:hypothetical protein